MTRFKTGDLVVATHRALNRHIGKVGAVHAVSRVSVEVIFLQPTTNGERITALFEDELILLTETKLDKLPYDIVP